MWSARRLFDGGEATDPEEVFLQGADEALDAAVALGLAHEGGRARDAEEDELRLVVVGDELAAVIVAQLQAARDPLGERAEAGAHALAKRLERLEAGRAAGGVDAQAFGRGVIHRDEDRRLAFAGQGRSQVRGPHLVDPLGADRAVVGLRAMRSPDPAWRQQVVRPHQPQDAALGRPDAGEAQPRPDLAVALTVEETCGQQLADRFEQRRVRHRPERPRSTAGA